MKVKVESQEKREILALQGKTEWRGKWEVLVYKVNKETSGDLDPRAN